MSSPPRLRTVGLAAGLAALALAAGFFLLTSGQESSTAATPHVVVPLSKRTKPHPAKPATPKPSPKTPVRQAKPEPKPKPAVKEQPVVSKGLPSSVAAALARHAVVVVSLYAPSIALDEMATREAKIGASTAGAGFVALNVLDERQIGPLGRLLGVLEDPAVLVFRRPGDLVVRFSGFADQQTVAQAARNVAL
jgi:hypothetical protein